MGDGGGGGEVVAHLQTVRNARALSPLTLDRLKLFTSRFDSSQFTSRSSKKNPKICQFFCIEVFCWSSRYILALLIVCRSQSDLRISIRTENQADKESEEAEVDIQK